MGRTDHWQIGDWIVHSCTGKRRRIQSITRYITFTKIRTMDGRNIIGEDVDFWDLEIPTLDLGT